jgi:hypothetical protein
MFFSFQINAVPFIAKPESLKKYYNRKDVVLVASPGQSESSQVALAVEKYASDYMAIESHLLPPNKKFLGKIIFIFSNPDKAAEAALHQTMSDENFGGMQFFHIETADANWLKKIGDTTQQTASHNLLSYDALGCYRHLVKWLKDKTPCSPQEARILAIKFESLGDPLVTNSIKEFLNIDDFVLPDEFCCHVSEVLSDKELELKALYNLSAPEEPRYKAYDKARKIWEYAPVIQYLK